MEASYETKTLEHLGLVAGMFEELGVGELIDEVIEQDFEQRQVTVGQAVKAMVLNGLGFANRRLYLSPHFFRNKPTEQLIGEGITAEMLNEDTLGKALDQLHSYGVSELYSLIAGRAVMRLGLTPKVAHDDITSFHVDGSYNSDKAPAADAKVVHITKGYSRDARPDLNQVALELIHENQAGIPVAMTPLSGNESDKSALCASVGAHTSNLQALGVALLVKDSAGYSEEALKAHQEVGLPWLMRVPATLTEAKSLLEETDPKEMQPLVEGYRYLKVSSHYGNISQRWLVIASQTAGTRAAKTAEQQLLKSSEREHKAFIKLCRQAFHCQEDALRALKAFRKTLKVLSVHDEQVVEKRHYGKRGRPAPDAAPEKITYHLQGALAAPRELRERHIERASLFILASNQLDEQKLSDAEILQAYKNQSKVEQGFRFLKDPMFLANTLFLKKVERLMALLMVMTVCLLVYAALQHRIRATLEEHEATVPDQKGKPTQRPTARWVFELFLDVHLLAIVQDTKRVLTMNLKQELRTLLRLLGARYDQLYP